MKPTFTLAIFSLTLLVGYPVFAAEFAAEFAADKPNKPNVLIMMVDDLGFSDLGCYGGEIDTPNLDQLAAGGLRLSQFYNTAKCHSSRVSLLTGQYCIAAGDTSLSHAVTSAEVLAQCGYSTNMVGKWHLKKTPTDFGFQRYFGHLSGACNYFTGDGTFRLNGQPWKVPQKLNGKDFYTTVANVDYAIDFLNETRAAKKEQQPWYMYVAFNAPHAPLQALPADYAKYQGRYDIGWDKIRTARVAKQKQLGIFANDEPPSACPEHVPAWDTLSESRKQFESKRMTTLAAMIDRVDQEIGRLVDDLKTNGELDNTLIWFVSDNGACPYDRRSNKLDALPTDGDVRWSDSTGWAWARNTPFRYYKQNQFEGGISSPAIIHWPNGIDAKPGSVDHTPAHLVDVLPTLSDVCSSPIPKTHPQRQLRPVSGVSLSPIFGAQSLSRPDPIHFLFSSDRGLRDGDWKAVSFRSEQWELYNVAKDRTEQNNLADDNRERLDSMVRRWTEMTRDVLHAPKKAYAETKPAKLPHRHPEWTKFDQPLGDVGKSGAKSGKDRGAKKSVRARKNTKMQINGDELKLTFTGDDPGIAIDSFSKEIQAGPYQLHFTLTSKAKGAGEIFYTTDPNVTLPKGERIEFPVVHNGKPHEFMVALPTDKSIQKLRIDVSEGLGSATIKNLRLTDSKGKQLLAWPPSQ